MLRVAKIPLIFGKSGLELVRFGPVISASSHPKAHGVYVLKLFEWLWLLRYNLPLIDTDTSNTTRSTSRHTDAIVI